MWDDIKLPENTFQKSFSDNYVHRLVQNKADGKLVEVSGGPAQVGDSEKVDSLQLEVRKRSLN